MLHVRTNPWTQTVAAAGALAGALRDRLAAIDPGLSRLMLAARGTSSACLAAGVALLAASLLKVPVTQFANAVTLSMVAPFLMREPTVRQRWLTLLTLPIPAAAATLAAGLLHGRGMAGDTAFLVLVFLCFLFHPRNPRFLGMGLVAVVTSYVGLYLELPPATLPQQLLALLAAVPIIAFACFVLVPMNPAATMRRIMTAIQWRAAQVLGTASRTTGDAGAPPPVLRRLRREIARLHEATLAADDHLALLEPTGREIIRIGLIELEIASARLIRRLQGETSGPRLANRLHLHARRMRMGQRYAMAPDNLEPGSLRAALVELGHAVHRLAMAVTRVEPARQRPEIAPLPPGPLAWRLSTRVTLAAGLAMAGGMALSPQRWFWAVMTVYVVFLNARSRGDTIYKGLQRLGGTVLGMVSALVLAALLARDQNLQIAALVLSIFGMFYFIMASYTAGIFCVTMMLGLLYGMLGAPLESLLMLRLEETAIGAAAAFFVAAFVFPTRTREEVIRCGKNVLAALADALRTSREFLLGAANISPIEAIRQVDRQVAGLRLALAPLTAGRTLIRRSAVERRVPALLECVHWTRVVAAASLDRGGLLESEEFIARIADIETVLAELAGMKMGDEGPMVLDARPTGAVSAANGSSQMEVALEHLSIGVAVLAERLNVGLLEGYAL